MIFITDKHRSHPLVTKVHSIIIMRKTASLSLLKIVFFISGFSSLVYQVAWQRILTLYYSVENISTTLIVTVYMLGLGIGAIIGGYLSEKITHRLQLYLLIELLIGLFGWASLPFLEFIGKSTAGSNYYISFIGMFLFLCLPTVLMGMTLPLLTKFYNDHIRHFFNSVSYLYFINTIGAAAGCLFSSYVLISFFGLDTSVYVAACLNIALALTVLMISPGFSRVENIKNEPVIDHEKHLHTKSKAIDLKKIYFIVFITGFIAIGYEIIWFRFIGTIVKASPYAFSSILFIYLTGIGLGSYFIKRYLARHPSIDRKNLFFSLQFFIAAFVLVSIIGYYYLVKYVPYFSQMNRASFITMEHPYPHLPRTDSPAHFFKDVFVILDVFLWPTIFILVPTILMGASFPLITSLAFRGRAAGSTIGKIYFFNVLGNVAGGLIAGLVLLQAIGSEYSILLLSFLGSLFLLFIDRNARIFRGKYKRPVIIALSILALLAFPRRQQLYNIIHPAIEYSTDEQKFITEGLDGVIVTYSSGNKLSTYINGMTHGGRPYATFYYEAIETLSFNSKMPAVLVIGFGTGSTVETIQIARPDAKITLVELSPTLIKNLNQVGYLRSMLDNDNLELVYADGRKYLYNSGEKFDAIFMDPLRTTTSFSNNLYSKQFFQIIKDHLKDTGVFMLWTDEHLVIPKTLCSVFPQVNKYSYFCIASNKLNEQDISFKSKMFNSFPPTLRDELFRIDSGENKPLDRAGILSYTRGLPINEDYKPYTEFYLGLFAHGRR